MGAKLPPDRTDSMTPPIRRLRLFAATALVSLALLAIACGGGGGDVAQGEGVGATQGATEGGGDQDSWSPRDIAVDPSAPVVAVNFGSPPGVGVNRMVFAFFDPSNALLSDLTADVRIFAVEDDAGTFVSEHRLRRVEMQPSTKHEHEDGALHDHPAAPVAVFVATPQFSHAGDWGAELSVERGGEVTVSRIRFVVLERTAEPMIGERIPASVQRVLRDVQDIAEIDSSLPPNPRLHDVTVAEALAEGRPLVIVFATPAFCQTRFCGPVVDEVVRPLEERHGEAATFIHIEPFDLAKARGGELAVLPVMAEWALTTEPWVFVVDRDGKLAAKFEGITSVAEVEGALLAVLE